MNTRTSATGRQRSYELDPAVTQPLPRPPMSRFEEPVAPILRHSRATIALHWASALAVVAAALAALARDWTENEALRVLLLDLHRQLGLFVLLALGLRLAVRLSKGMADHVSQMAVLMRFAAHAAHLLLYGLLLALPVLGVATTQAHETPVRLFGLFTLPSIVKADPDLADTLSDYHLWASWVLLAAVTLHIAAALWHHAVKRDGVLAAMLPWVRRKRGR